MAISLGDAVVTFKADLTDLNKSIGDATRGMKKEFGNLMGVASTVGKSFTIMGGAITAGLGAIVTSTANAGDEIFDMSKKTGFTTEAVSKWAFALKQSGGDVSTLQTAVRGMSNVIDAARQGTTSAVETLARLNLTVADFAGLSPEAAFQKLAMAVAAVPDPMTRAAIAQDVFGKSGMSMLPALAEGEAGLRGMFDEAQRAGAVFTEAEAAMGDQFNDALGSLTAALQGAGKEIAITLIPSLVELIGYVREIVISMSSWIQAHPVLTEWIVKIGGAIGALMVVVGPLLMMLPGLAIAFTALGPVIATVGGVIAGIGAPILIAVAAITALIAAGWALYSNWEEVKGFLADLWESLKQIAADTLQGLGAVVREAMDNVLWAFTNPLDAIAAAWEGLKNFFIGWWKSVIGFFQTGYDFVAGIISEIARGVDWVWDKLSFGFNGAPQAMAEGGIARGGLTLVGERGPELVNMPKGARVYPADETRSMLSGGGSTSFSFGNIVVSGVNDPDAIAAVIARKIEERAQNVFAKRGMRLAAT